MKRLATRFLCLFLSVTMLFSLETLAFASDVSALSSETPETALDVIITDSGVYIHDIYYSRAEFMQLLDTSVEISVLQPMSAAGALMAGAWLVPGIGEIVVTAAGVIFIAGVAVEAGSWIIDAVKQWFADKASQETQEAYNDAKEKGEPTDDHYVQNGGSSLPKKGNPNSSKDHVVDGSLKQRRYYDKNGDADMDIDYHHSGVKHKFPHRHYWNNNVRGPEMPF